MKEKLAKVLGLYTKASAIGVEDEARSEIDPMLRELAKEASNQLHTTLLGYAAKMHPIITEVNELEEKINEFRANNKAQELPEEFEEKKKLIEEKINICTTESTLAVSLVTLIPHLQIATKAIGKPEEKKRKHFYKG